MALVIENGSGVSGANSYASAAVLGNYASLRGLSAPATDADKEKLLILAMDAIESLEETFLGDRADAEQALAWPRTDSTTSDGSIILSNGQIVANTAIPAQLVSAQCQLAIDLQSADYFPLSSGQVVTEETVGPITTKYAAPDQGGGDGISASFQKFNAILSILQRASALTLQTIRI